MLRTERKCGNCDYMAKNPDTSRSTSVCRRYPPTVLGSRQELSGLVVTASWPEVVDTDWCGEFSPKK